MTIQIGRFENVDPVRQKPEELKQCSAHQVEN
jgi:hypothetical protein